MVRIAAFNPDTLFLQRVSVFNSKHQADDMLEVVDYCSSNGGNNVGDIMMRLENDYSSGNEPDIFYWTFSSGAIGFDAITLYNQGILLDMQDLLSADSYIDDSVFVPSLINTLKTRYGGLYELPVEFRVHTVACTSIGINSTRWSFDDFLEVSAARGNPQISFGLGLTQGKLLALYLMNNMDNFVEWNTGNCRFDSDWFVEMLQFCKTQTWENKAFLLQNEAIAQGHQFLVYDVVSDVSSVQKFRAILGGDVRFIGFPTVSGIGNSMAPTRSISISRSSKSTGTCWEFIRDLVSEEFQYDSLAFFPSNRNALNRRLEHPEDHEGSGVVLKYQSPDNSKEFEIRFSFPTQADSKQVRELIYSLDRVYRPCIGFIQSVYSEAQTFFSGDSNAKSVAQSVQKLATFYFSNSFV